jgi:hypothetical protein
MFATFLLEVCHSSCVSQRPAPASAPAYTQIPRAPSRIEAIGIVIPATNQSEAVAKCIFSLFAANNYSGWRHSLWIIVVADACTDDTARVARDALGAFGQVLEVRASSRQTAHRIGAGAVVEHFINVPRHALLLTSTEVTADLSRDWIEREQQISQSPVGLAAKPG